MKKKRLSKLQLKEKQKLDEKYFNRALLISFSILFLSVMSTLIFYTYWCDTKYTWRKITLYGKEVPAELVCMNEDNLQVHESTKEVFEGRTYYFCSSKCFSHLKKHFKEVALTPDAFSGDSINKAYAIIGLRKRNNPELVYFKNKESFNKYYESKHKK